ncbi:MAG TPA: DUF2279 domain-containing protein [Flavisolibacter sp.]|nr:DUF2279 domain-containing protein [Flavisolibacter sp.]
MKKLLFLIYLISSLITQAQPISDSTSIIKNEQSNTNRIWLISGLTTVSFGGSFVYLNEAWYKDYKRAPLHAYNDIGEWQQVDKVGHMVTAYHTSRIYSGMWKWAGVPDKKAVLLGTGSSLLYMLSIEYLDGRSAEWGWSWADAGADILGSALFASQELLWKDQKIQFKFSTTHKKYNGDLKQRADKLFGASFQERLIKDYNAQTYWLSLNASSILPNTNLPKWLNFSLGYGADNMFGGYTNIVNDENGNVIFDRSDLKRFRQWYLAPDVDFTKIKTNSRLLKTVFFAFNFIKFPAPAFELSKGKIKFHAIAF